MKKLIIVSAIALSILSVKQADAQLGIHVNLHFGTQPVYRPAPPVAVVVNDNYDNDDDYYYLPDVEAYYSVSANSYYYQDGGRWISAAYLPGEYRNYNWRNARKFEIHASRPFMRHEQYRTRFGGYAYRDRDQRGYPNYGRDQRNDNRGYGDRNQQYGNNQGRGGRDDRYNDNRGQGGYNQPNRNNDQQQGGYGQPNQGRGQQQGGGYSQPNQNGNQGGSYGQPSGQGRGQQQGGYGQPNQNSNQGGNNSQPTNQNRGGQGSGSGQHFTQNGAANVGGDRSQMMASRPVRF